MFDLKEAIYSWRKDLDESDSLTHIFVLVAVMFVICKVFSLGKTGRLLSNSRIATIGLLVSGAGVVLLRMTSQVMPAFTVRILSAEEYGRIMIASQVGMLVWTVLGPIILAVILIRFGRSNRKIFA